MAENQLGEDELEFDGIDEYGEEDGSGMDDEGDDNASVATTTSLPSKETLQNIGGGKITKGGKGTKGKGNRRTVKDGMKLCTGCNRWREVALFPAGFAEERECRQAVQNLRNAAGTQGKGDWMKDKLSDPKTTVQMIWQYFVRCPQKNPSKKASRRPVFACANYIEEERRERQLLLDGIYEMMHERHYIYFMSKPKNGCIEAEVARKDWLELCKKTGALVDMRGPTERYARRVAVKKSDLVIHRDLHAKSQSVQKKGKDFKKPTENQLLDLEKTLEGEIDAGARTREDQARQMLTGAAVQGSDGAFSSTAVGALSVGDVTDLVPDLEADAEEDQSDAKEESVSEHAKTPVKKAVRDVTWYGRDEAVIGAEKVFTSWKADMGKSIQEAVALLAEAESQAADQSVVDRVRNEIKLMKNRQTALLLIRGRVQKLAVSVGIEASKSEVNPLTEKKMGQHDKGGEDEGDEAEKVGSEKAAADEEKKKNTDEDVLASVETNKSVDVVSETPNKKAPSLHEKSAKHDDGKGAQSDTATSLLADCDGNHTKAFSIMIANSAPTFQCASTFFLIYF